MDNLPSTELLNEITQSVIQELKKYNVNITSQKSSIPVSVSARHIHLQKEHVEILFGKAYKLTQMKEISQPGQFACREVVTIQGPKGEIHNVRVLGPLRSQTQVEISRSDGRRIGIIPPVRNSGNLTGSAPVKIIGPVGNVALKEGCIIADRHIHMTPLDAKEYGVLNNQKVSVLVEGEKGGLMNEVTIRVKANYALDMHVDTDDANAFGLSGNEWLKIIPFSGGSSE